MGFLSVAGKVGNGLLNVTDAVFTGAGKVGMAAGKVGLKVSDKAFIEGTKMAGKMAVSSLGPLKMAGDAATGLGKRMVYRRPELKHLNRETGEVVIDQEGGLKLTKLGMGVIFGAGALGSVMDGAHKMEGKNMGQSSPKVYTPTPEVAPQKYVNGFVDNGGATGDLVFALHNNR